MTLDAMDWVWRYSRTRGNPRLLLLAVADAVTGPDATASMGAAEVMRRLGTTAKSTAVDAVAAALASGELTLEQPGAGTRPARYCIPGAVGYTSASGRESRPQESVSGRELRPLTTPSGRDSRPLAEPDDSQRSEIPTASPQRSGIPTARADASGRESRPLELWSEPPAECVTRAQASIKNNRMNEGGSELPAVIPGGIPDLARPLVDTLTASGVIVRWDLGPGEWLTLDAMIQRSGVDLLAAAAVKAAAKADISHARYLLRAWRSLPPAPAAGTTPVPAPIRHGADVIPLGQPRRSRAQRTADMLGDILAREAQQ